MSRIEWTQDQKAVIGLRGHDMLISAAAGSGKTAVLTERIISRLFEEKAPVHIDEMLVMTYTDSAAQEMRGRIQERLQQAADGDSERARRAREELIRLPQAQISTIHGFCSSVIRTWFNVIDLEPDFRVCADDGERTMLQTECLEKLMEEEYAAGRPEFIEFVRAYGGTRDDREIMGQIRQLHETALSFPNPSQWLHDSLRYYEISEGNTFASSDLAGLIVLQSALTAEELTGRCRALLDQCLRPGGPYVYEETVADDLAFLEAVSNTRSWEDMRDICLSHEWLRLPGGKDDSIDPDLRTACKNERGAIKEQFAKLIVTPFFSFSEEEIIAHLQTAYRQGRELVRLTLRFDAAFTELKRSRKVIDFSDMEHLALQILRTRDESGAEVIAQEYRSHFAEVMVDEYQDSNYLQDEILKAVSGGSGRHNLFMVGDVKQSIYRFRNARPDLFVGKQRQFDLYEQGKTSLLKRTLILLRQNFRSVPQVLDFVNLLFFRLMGRDVGDIDYDEGAALYQGRKIPDDTPKRPCEVWVVPYGPERARAEARCVARRMKEMLAHEQIADRQTGKMRPVRFGDMVILSRSLSVWADEFYEALSDEGIPVFMSRKSGYFQTLEVGTVLDFLRLVGNERQDLPLGTVMTSCIGRFTDTEMAMIRTAYRDKAFFHEAVLAYLEHPADRSLGEKLKGFMELIHSFREQAPFMPVDRLIAQIMEETGVRRYMEAMPGGLQRRANLAMLLERARSFVRTGYRGLTGFLEYIELMDQNNVDYGEAGLFDEQADVVRMTTIHKSKGLEYPIVFLVGLGRGFNRRDVDSKVAVHPEYGLGLYSWDVESREKASTPVREIVRRRLNFDDLGEEMRVLYVACTRARERLILTGCLRGVVSYEDVTERYSADRRPGLLPLFTRTHAQCFYDWILPVVTAAEETGGDASVRLMMDTADGTIAAGTETPAGEESSFETDPDVSGASFEVTVQGISPGMQYHYPYEKTADIPQKVSVSELKRRKEELFLRRLGEDSSEDEPDAYGEASVHIRTPKPRFALNTMHLSASERGTIHHRLLQLLDLSCRWNESRLAETVERFAENGYFEYEETQAIQTDRVLAFLNSPLCRRMGDAQKAGCLKREQPFVIGVDASEINGEWQQGETVLVQGMIDAWFEENGQLIVLDYKTDRVRTADELIGRYREQMDWYARALRQLTGKKVSERYLVSLELDQVIPL